MYADRAGRWRSGTRRLGTVIAAAAAASFAATNATAGSRMTDPGVAATGPAMSATARRHAASDSRRVTTTTRASFDDDAAVAPAPKSPSSSPSPPSSSPPSSSPAWGRRILPLATPLAGRRRRWRPDGRCRAAARERCDGFGAPPREKAASTTTAIGGESRTVSSNIAPTAMDGAMTTDAARDRRLSRRSSFLRGGPPSARW